MLATSSTTLWYATRATGVVALLLLTITVVLGVLTAGRLRTKRWPAFANAELHKRLSIITVVFLAIHILTSVLDTYVHIGWASVVVPFPSSYQPFWTGLGTVGVDLLLAVMISSALRQRISPRLWRGLHWLAYGSWPVALAHALGMGSDAKYAWLQALAAACIAAVAAAVVWRVRDARRAADLARRSGALTRTLTPVGTPSR